MYCLNLYNTNLCNLACTYCFTDAKGRLPNELTFEEKANVIDQAKKMGAYSVNLCGSGEPMLDPDFRELITYIKSKKLHIFIATNGTVINRDLAQFLYNNKVSLIYKINALNKTCVDSLVGRNNMKWVQYRDYLIPETLLNLINVGYGRKKFRNFVSFSSLTLESIMCKTNLEYIPELTRLARELGVPIYLERLIMEGRAIANKSSIELDEDTYRKLYKQVAKIYGIGFRIGERLRVCHVERNPIIDSQGNMQVCCARKEDIGNIREYSLKELWKKRKQLNIECMRHFSQLGSGTFKICKGKPLE